MDVPTFPGGASAVHGLVPTGQLAYNSVAPSSLVVVLTKSSHQLGVCAAVRQSGPEMPPVTKPSIFPGMGQWAHAFPFAIPGDLQGFPNVMPPATRFCRLFGMMKLRRK